LGSVDFLVYHIYDTMSSIILTTHLIVEPRPNCKT